MSNPSPVPQGMSQIEMSKVKRKVIWGFEVDPTGYAVPIYKVVYVTDWERVKLEAKNMSRAPQKEGTCPLPGRLANEGRRR